MTPEPVAARTLQPARILQIATAFWPAKVLLSAIELGVFTKLAARKLTNRELAQALDIRPDRSPDFFDALLALGFLQREGDGADALYENSPETDFFLDKNKPSYIGGMPEMLNARLYGFWDGLTEALRSGRAQNESKGAAGESPFPAMYADEARLEQFLSAMSSLQTSNFEALARAYDFSRHETVLDVGGANGQLCRVLRAHYPKLSLLSFDLPEATHIARREVEKAKLSSPIQLLSGDFFVDALPAADVVVMGNILHDWNEEKKRHLIAKAFATLPQGGAFIAIENVIDNPRRVNLFGLLMSLNMLIETGAEGGFDYTGAQFDAWCREAGFARTEVVPLTGPTSAAVAYKA